MCCEPPAAMGVRGQLWAIMYGADDDSSPGLNQPEVLQSSLTRIAKIVPHKRIVVAATAPVLERWSSELAKIPAENQVTVPYGRGAPAAVLLPFFHIFRSQPTSRILVLPVNHRVSDEPLFLAALTAAVQATPDDDNRAVLVGMREVDPLLPGELILTSESGVKNTRGIVKVDPTVDPDVRGFHVERGALLSSGIFAAGSSAMLRLFDHALPGMLRSFLSSLRGQTCWSPETLGRLFRFLQKKELGRDLFAPSAELLRVSTCEPCGYRNLENSERLLPKFLLAEPNGAVPLLTVPRPPLELLPS